MSIVVPFTWPADSPARSSATGFVKPATPCLAATQVPYWGEATGPWIEAMLITRLRPFIIASAPSASLHPRLPAVTISRCGMPSSS